MYANYHTHTYLCRHAVGDPRTYVENAIRAGIKVLGFSDHVPYPFSIPDYESTFRMALNDTAEYLNIVSNLRKEYGNRIKIYIGYEAEYYPNEFDSMLEHIKNFECDYLILGQHCFNNEYDGTGTGWPTTDSALLKKYVDQVIEAINTGKFSYIAHPDVINYQGDIKLYQSEMARLCEAAKKLSIPLEINLLGLEERRHYPNDALWSIVGDIGNDVILGCDAHRPEALGDSEIESAALAYAAKFGIIPMKMLELKHI